MKRPLAKPRTSAHRALRGALAALALAAAAAPAPAEAQQACLGGAGGLAFGTYDPFSSAPLDSTSTIFALCPAGRTVRISIDAGHSRSFAARTLRSGSEVLRYNLYLDAARTVVWGDGTGGSSVRTSGGGLVVATVYGRIPPGQDPVVGAYRDVIRVTFDL